MNVYRVMQVLSFKGYAINKVEDCKYSLVDLKNNITCIFDFDTGEVLDLTVGGAIMKNLDDFAITLGQKPDETISFDITEEGKLELLDLAMGYDLTVNSAIIKILKRVIEDGKLGDKAK